VDELRAAHTGTQPPRVTVLAHSYVTLVTGLAARQGLAADAITICQVFVTDPAARVAAGGFSVLGPINVTANGVYAFGPDPSLPRLRRPACPAFGAQPIPLDPRQHGHSEYYELNTRGIDALTRIMLGRVDRVPR
jgi:hypothetical protein